MNNEETILLYFSICFAILLPFGILKYIAREKYVASAYQHPEVKRKMLKHLNWVVPSLRIFMLLSPLYLILLPWLLSKYAGLGGVAVFSCMALMFANVCVEYGFRKWLYQFLVKDLA